MLTSYSFGHSGNMWRDSTCRHDYSQVTKPGVRHPGVMIAVLPPTPHPRLHVVRTADDQTTAIKLTKLVFTAVQLVSALCLTW